MRLKKQLKGKDVILIKGEHCQYDGQILGCSIKKFQKDVDAFLYIGDGMFHPRALMFYNEKDVFVFNPFSKTFSKLNTKEVEKIKKRVKVGLVKFHSSKEIGIIVSTKPGQNRMKDAMELEKRFGDKNFYLFVCDTLDFNQLENFPFVECWVNTACPRIGLDDEVSKVIININDIE